MSLPPGVRLDDPCPYCGRKLADIMAQGCGSQEIREPDRFCHVAAWAARQRVARKE
jgi:hypothetical protein